MSAHHAQPAGIVPANSKYHAGLEVQHFGRGATAGSVFTIVDTLKDWLRLAEDIRGSLSGNDCDLVASELRAAGVDEDAITRTLRSDCRYLLIKSQETVGNFGMVEIRSLAKHQPGTPLLFSRPKPGAPHSLLARDSKELDRSTSLATIVIGSDDGVSEILFTTHPGLPIPSTGREVFPAATDASGAPTLDDRTFRATVSDILTRERPIGGRSYAKLMPADAFDRLAARAVELPEPTQRLTASPVGLDR